MVESWVVVGPAERKFPPAMAPLGMSANGWSEFRMVPPTIDPFTTPVSVQGVTAVQIAGDERSRKDPEPPPREPVTCACAPSDAARATDANRVLPNFIGLPTFFCCIGSRRPPREVSPLYLSLIHIS